MSIGDKEKLGKFLNLNPAVPRELAFVDGYELEAYAAAGFGSFGQGATPDATKAATRNMKPPGFGTKQWWSYLTNVASLSPIPTGLKFGEVPQGVLRLGGTFLVREDEVIFAHSDKIPGDHPNIDTIMKLVNKNGDCPGLAA